MIKIDSKESETSQGVRKLISAGAILVGATVTSMIEASLPGVTGMVLAATDGYVISEIVNELASRVLAPRQQVRVGATFSYAVKRITERIEKGDSIRNDQFFASSIDNRSPADEVFEGVLLKAQNEYEEEKIRHYGYFFANICFDSNIDQGTANYILRMAERLSYRQYCLLRMFHLVDEKQLYDHNPDFRRMKDISEGRGAIGLTGSVLTADILSDIRELETLSLVTAMDVNKMYFYNVSLSGIGDLLHKSLELDRLNENHLQTFFKQISSKELR